MRETLSNACEIVGWIAVAVASWFITPWLALIWLGLTFMTVGYVLGDE